MHACIYVRMHVNAYVCESNVCTQTWCVSTCVHACISLCTLYPCILNMYISNTCVSIVLPCGCYPLVPSAWFAPLPIPLSCKWAAEHQTNAFGDKRLINCDACAWNVMREDEDICIGSRTKKHTHTQLVERPYVRTCRRALTHIHVHTLRSSRWIRYRTFNKWRKPPRRPGWSKKTKTATSTSLPRSVSSAC